MRIFALFLALNINIQGYSDNLAQNYTKINGCKEFNYYVFYKESDYLEALKKLVPEAVIFECEDLVDKIGLRNYNHEIYTYSQRLIDYKTRKLMELIRSIVNKSVDERTSIDNDETNLVEKE